MTVAPHTLLRDLASKHCVGHAATQLKFFHRKHNYDSFIVNTENSCGVYLCELVQQLSVVMLVDGLQLVQSDIFAYGTIIMFCC